MLYVRPDYYQKFKCTADRCEATCCAGWQIVIDQDSLKRYQAENGEYADTLKKRIDWSEGVFYQDCRKRCTFLKEDNLCEMYQQLGEESLCFTCTNYPRHMETFENLREITLAVSCPEVARILLELKDPVQFVEEETQEDQEEDEEFDPFFFSYLEDARGIMLKLLQDRSLSIPVRVLLVRKMAEEMQEIIEEGELFELADVLAAYEEECLLANALDQAERDLKLFFEETEKQAACSRAVFGRLYELEHLNPGWEDYIKQCEKILYDRGAEAYRVLQEGFKEACACMDMEIILEQLLVYFVTAYFCGSVYDGNAAGRMHLAVDSVHILYQLFLAKWREQKEQLSVQDMQRIVYGYSRELEHSDVNLEIMMNT